MSSCRILSIFICAIFLGWNVSGLPKQLEKNKNEKFGVHVSPILNAGSLAYEDKNIPVSLKSKKEFQTLDNSPEADKLAPLKNTLFYGGQHEHDIDKYDDLVGAKFGSQTQTFSAEGADEYDDISKKDEDDDDSFDFPYSSRVKLHNAAPKDDHGLQNLNLMHESKLKKKKTSGSEGEFRSVAIEPAPSNLQETGKKFDILLAEPYPGYLNKEDQSHDNHALQSENFDFADDDLDAEDDSGVVHLRNSMWSEENDDYNNMDFSSNMEDYQEFRHKKDDLKTIIKDPMTKLKDKDEEYGLPKRIPSVGADETHAEKSDILNVHFTPFAEPDEESIDKEEKEKDNIRNESNVYDYDDETKKETPANIKDVEKMCELVHSNTFNYESEVSRSRKNDNRGLIGIAFHVKAGFLGTTNFLLRKEFPFFTNVLEKMYSWLQKINVFSMVQLLPLNYESLNDNVSLNTASNNPALRPSHDSSFRATIKRYFKFLLLQILGVRRESGSQAFNFDLMYDKNHAKRHTKKNESKTTNWNWYLTKILHLLNELNNVTVKSTSVE